MRQRSALLTRRPTIPQDVQKAVRLWPGASIDDIQQILPYHASYSELYHFVQQEAEFTTRNGQSVGLAAHYVGRKLFVYDAAVPKALFHFGRILVDDNYRAIVRFLATNGPSSGTEIYKGSASKLERSQLDKKLGDLLEWGHLEKIPRPPATHLTNQNGVYRLTPDMVDCINTPAFNRRFMGEQVRTPEMMRCKGEFPADTE